MSEMAAASVQQSTGIEQVNQAVSQMDQVTQQNAALVEEASAAAQSMAQQAQELREAVAVFRVADTGPSTSRAAIAQRKPRQSVPKASPARRQEPNGTRTTTAVNADTTAAVFTKPKTTPVTTADRDSRAATDTGAADWQAF